jgi:RNA polymerase-binding transcription factor DksA
MGIQVSDMHLLRDQLTSRRQKLETAVARSAMARNTLEKTQTANLLQLLGQVDRALERMDRGAFGICEVPYLSRSRAPVF